MYDYEEREMIGGNSSSYRQNNSTLVPEKTQLRQGEIRKRGTDNASSPPEGQEQDQGEAYTGAQGQGHAGWRSAPERDHLLSKLGPWWVAGWLHPSASPDQEVW